jgi:hypothetical protein
LSITSRATPEEMFSGGDIPLALFNRHAPEVEAHGVHSMVK